jgi:hypothetical protein
MIRTSIIPNSNIILSPFEAYLNIVIMSQKIQEMIQKDFTFTFRNIIDMTDVMTDGEYRFPTRNRICTNHLPLASTKREIQDEQLQGSRRHSLVIHEAQCGV